MANRLVLGITGGIAAYKTPNLIRLFVKAGWDVQVLVTQEALRFVSKETLEVVSQNKVIDNLHEGWDTSAHLVNREADCLVIAPCTANTLAKLAEGQADNIVTATYLAYQGPVFIAPSMHTEMLNHASTKRNLEQVKKDGVHIIAPDSGDLACGDVGEGRLPDEAEIAKVVHERFPKPLLGKRILISAGGTREKIDAVRFIGNASSGMLGHALAEEALSQGAEVTLVTASPLESPKQAKRIDVVSSSDLHHALKAEIDSHDVLIMAAAVSDFTVPYHDGKLSRDSALTLSLTPTPDILKELGATKRPDQTFIGFCLNDDDPVSAGKEKLARKNCDLIIANTSQAINSELRDFWVISDTEVKKESQVTTTTMSKIILKNL